MTPKTIHVAYFISPHGFGHAARASAVMTALHKHNPRLHFEVFTSVPRWFFQDSLPCSFTFHSTLTDIGLAQKSSLVEDVAETIRRLDQFLPYPPERLEQLARQIKRRDCALALCDITPLGIAVARAARIPSVLVENFTWDWIYRPYARQAARLREHASYLRARFREANVHIQTEPVCSPGTADLTAPPVSREPRTSRRQIRRQLGIPQNVPAVLVTMGGIPEQHSFVDRLQSVRGSYFILPGAVRRESRRGSIILLPHRSAYYHPDLMNAADAVIGKSGYSTVAEAFRAGVPIGFVGRPIFPESRVVTQFISTRMAGIEISFNRFQSGDWLGDLPALLSLPRIEPKVENGAETISRFLLERFDLGAN